jgi:hypothetical protein
MAEHYRPDSRSNHVYVINYKTGTGSWEPLFDKKGKPLYLLLMAEPDAMKALRPDDAPRWQWFAVGRQGRDADASRAHFEEDHPGGGRAALFSSSVMSPYLVASKEKAPGTTKARPGLRGQALGCRRTDQVDIGTCPRAILKACGRV